MAEGPEGYRMNKRIREFAEQCSHHRSPPETWFDYEKFAEFIVRECVEKCESIGFEWHKIDSTRASGKKAGAFECAVELKKHFKIK